MALGQFRCFNSSQSVRTMSVSSLSLSLSVPQHTNPTQSYRQCPLLYKNALKLVRSLFGPSTPTKTLPQLVFPQDSESFVRLQTVLQLNQRCFFIFCWSATFTAGSRSEVGSSSSTLGFAFRPRGSGVGSARRVNNFMFMFHSHKSSISQRDTVKKAVDRKGLLF